MGYLENRIRYLIKMFVYLFDFISEKEAERLILSTKAGQEIINKNASYLYETIQSNLQGVLDELAQEDKKYEAMPEEIEKAYSHALRHKWFMKP